MQGENDLRIGLITHACISIETRTDLLICDPWFEQGIFNDSWNLAKTPDLSKVNFEKLNHIWISHEHPDHLNFATLRKIKRMASRPITVYFRKQDNPNVVNAIREIGFETIELDPHKEVKIAPKLSVNLFPTGMDSALVFRYDNQVILNQNDCQLNSNEVSAIQKEYPSIDYWFFQFSLAGYYANHDDPLGLDRGKRKHLQLIKKYYNAFRPRMFIPFASFVIFSKECNDYLNRWRVSLDDVMHMLPGVTQILWEHDNILQENWYERNIQNIQRWNEAFSSHKEGKPHASIDTAELEKAGKALMASINYHSIPRIFVPTETHFKIRDDKRVASIDFRKKKFAIKESVDKSKLAGILPSEELLFFLKYPFGADTLNITSCFYIINRYKWRWVMHYRDSLYVRDKSNKLSERLFLYFLYTGLRILQFRGL